MENHQFDLPGFDASPLAAPAPLASGLEHNLFFALMPPPDVAQQLADWTDALCTHHGLGGKPRPAALLHVSLHGVWAGKTAVPLAVVERAMAAAARVQAASCELVFEQVMSFARSPRSGRYPLVLRHTDVAATSALHTLHRRLGLALAQAGFRVSGSFTPHVTLSYALQALPEQAVTPVMWPATRFVLIDSHVGHSRYERLAEWPLMAQP